MKLSLIVAVANNNAIGQNNDLLWHLPADMQFFKSTTTGHCVITGRKNYFSIPAKFRPLANRLNIVCTRNKAQFENEEGDFLLAESLEEALKLAEQHAQNQTTFIIGGGTLYREALEKNLVSEMYITHVEADFPNADTYFPSVDFSGWTQEQLLDFKQNERNPFNFKIVKYTKK